MKRHVFYSPRIIDEHRNYLGKVEMVCRKRWWWVKWGIGELDGLVELSDVFLGDRTGRWGSREELKKMVSGAFRSGASWSKEASALWSLRWGYASGIDEEASKNIGSVIVMEWTNRIMEWERHGIDFKHYKVDYRPLQSLGAQ